MPDDLDLTKGLRGGAPEKPTGGKKCLLTIAINKYDGSNGYGRLYYPVSNAVEIANVLKKYYGFTEIISIIDDKCTEGGIIDAIKQARSCAGESGQLVVYFTGHGAAEGSDGYWIPFDSKKEIVDNCSIVNILQLLMGHCNQVLLLVDCCFSGTTIDAALPMALFKKDRLEKSVFSLITAGNKHDKVPDNSIFFEALFNILRYEPISSITNLVSQLEKQMDLRGSRTKIKSNSIGDQSSQSFLLERDDRISYELGKSLLEFNFIDQDPYLDGITTFNMTYLRGTESCGHEILMRRYFRRNDICNSTNFNSLLNRISFGGEEISASYSMWDQLAVALKATDNKPDTIIEKIVGDLHNNNFFLIVRIKGSCIESEMEKALREFWEKLLSYAHVNKNIVGNFTYRVYLFIWDVRGNTDDIGNIITKDRFKSLLFTSYAKLLPLPRVSEVEREVFQMWYSRVNREYTGLKKDERFGTLEFDKLSTPRTVMNVIAQIEEVFDKKDTILKLFDNI